MVLTPQLLQAIKLLQMPNAELAAFIEAELERNPLLERADEAPIFEAPAVGGEGEAEAAASTTPEPGDWASEALESDPQTLAGNLGTEIDNAFELDRPATPAATQRIDEGQGLSAVSWTGAGGRGFDEEAPDLEAYLAQPTSFSEHLTRQAMIVLDDPIDRMIATMLIDALDEAGYLTAPLHEAAERLGAPLARVEAVLTRLQGLEPTGVFARSLAECLALQLIERDRCDPAMQALIANLPALARRDFATLRRVCGVDDEDLGDMIAEIRRLDPKPGRAFGAPVEPPAIPDVFVTAAPDHSWRVERNSEALPRVLINETYATRVKRNAGREQDRQFLSSNLQTANWLTKSLEQRARTILNVASEIVRRQDAFFVVGVAGLRPLNLKTVADAIGAARPVRDEVLLHHADRLGGERRQPGAFGRVGAVQDQADDRRRGSRRGAFRRRDRRPPAPGRHRRRAPDSGQVSRQSAHSVVGRAPADENVRVSLSRNRARTSKSLICMAFKARFGLCALCTIDIGSGGF